MSFKTTESKANIAAIVGCIAYLSWHIYSAVAAGRVALKFIAW